MNSPRIRPQHSVLLAALSTHITCPCSHRGGMPCRQHSPLLSCPPRHQLPVPRPNTKALTHGRAGSFSCLASGSSPWCAGSTWDLVNLLVCSRAQESLSFIDRMPLQAPRHSCRLAGCAHELSSPGAEKQLLHAELQNCFGRDVHEALASAASTIPLHFTQHIKKEKGSSGGAGTVPFLNTRERL